MDNQNAQQLIESIQKAERIVFFGGAGVSTESGIPDFRSQDGLYHLKYDYPPETILSHSFFLSHTMDFFKFYKEKILAPALSCLPNPAHTTLTKLEQQKKLCGIITQNIDGLHQAAGSKSVFELHGSVHRNYCMRCGKFHDAAYMYHQDGIPHCSCGGIIKPDVVLYEESLDNNIVNGAIHALCTADLLIIGGTSLAVYPAAGLIEYFQGDQVVLLNKTPTPADHLATLVIREPIGALFAQINDAL